MNLYNYYDLFFNPYDELVKGEQTMTDESKTEELVEEEEEVLEDDDDELLEEEPTEDVSNDSERKVN